LNMQYLVFYLFKASAPAAIVLLQVSRGTKRLSTERGPMSNWSGTVSKPRTLRALGALYALANCGLSLLAQAAPLSSYTACSTGLAQEPSECTVTLTAKQTIDLQPVVPSGTVRVLTAEQAEGTVELRLPDAAKGTAPYANRAGLHSRIQFHLASGPQQAQTVRLTNPSQKPARVLISFTPASPEDSMSEQERAAEYAFAHAEFLRVQGSKDQSSEALAAYDNAVALWRQLGNQQELARALIWKSFYLFIKQSDYAGALRIASQARQLIPQLQPVEAANCWKITGFVNAQLAHYDAAANAYQQALALFTDTGDLFNQEVVLDNLAKVERLEGQSESALRHATRAAELAAQLGDAHRQLGIEEEIGAIDLSEGDLESANSAYESALLLLKSAPDPRLEGYIWSEMGVLYTLMGDFTRAEDALNQATEIWKLNPDTAGELNTLDDYGDLLLERNQPAAARAYYTRGLQLAEKSSVDRARTFLLRGIGKSFLQQGSNKDARENLEQALKLAGEINEADSVPETLCLLGDTAGQEHDFTRAARDYEQCRQAAIAAHDTYTEIRAEGGLAEIGFESGALEEAETHCERALGGIEAIRGHLRDQDLRTSYFASQHAYYDLEIQILMRMGLAHPGEGYQWRAFLIAERARARTLLDQVTASSDVRAAASQALIAEYEDLQRRLRRLETKPSGNGGSQGSQSEISRRSAIARLTVGEGELRREIADSGEVKSASASSLTLESLESLLPDDHSVLMEYWTGESGSYAWSLTRGGIRSFHLPPAGVLDRKCASFRKALLAATARDPRVSVEESVRTQSAKEAHWKQLGANLAASLFPPGALLPSTSTVLVVEDGAVETLPLVALPGLSMIPGTDGRLRRIAFLNEPSATIFAFLEERSMNPRPVRLAVFTGDASADTRSAEHGREIASNTGALAALPFTSNEADSIREIFGADAVQTFPSASLSPSTLQNLDWQQFTIGHFAMHAVLNQKYAELTALSSGDSSVSRSHSRRLLWYGDIRNLHLRLELVGLSACDTALGTQIPGEGLRGLTQAFFAAGSQRVLGTLWEVDDQATSEWMRHFYQALKETHSPAKALRRAQQAMAADPQWSDPYYWAGFVLAGDWRPIP
jgi:tetratricopeptide (TPR) repeat protein